MSIEKEIKNLLFLNRPVQSGFDYRDWPVIVPINNGTDIDIQLMHWEYIPPTIHDADELIASRKNYIWLNAKQENLFVNEQGRTSMYKEGATKGRILVLSSGFYEWRHIPKIGKRGQPLKQTDRIPYHITVNNQEYFFMAGVSRVWYNMEMDQSAPTFAIVTTEANELMQKIHNTKKRMPVILPPHLAVEWLQKDLPEKRIKEIAAHQFNAEEMTAWTVGKNFDQLEEPYAEVHYDNLPPL